MRPSRLVLVALVACAPSPDPDEGCEAEAELAAAAPRAVDCGHAAWDDTLVQVMGCEVEAFTLGEPFVSRADRTSNLTLYKAWDGATLWIGTTSPSRTSLQLAACDEPVVGVGFEPSPDDPPGRDDEPVDGVVCGTDQLVAGRTCLADVR